jgi:hypothetical protein
VDVGLVALGHGRPEVQASFRERARSLGLIDRILQIPFLPHWRVPEFLRGCLAVCCLEQNFPIGFHTPIVPREVLLCGRCLVGSTEVIRKLPGCERLPHGYGCVAIENVNDIEALGEQLASIVKDPEPAAAVGARGRDFARALQQQIRFPEMVEKILKAAASRRRLPAVLRVSVDDGDTKARNARFPLTQLVATALAEMHQDQGASRESAQPELTIDLAAARELLVEVERDVAEGKTLWSSMASALQVEIAIAEAESAVDGAVSAPVSDPLFRLHMRQWAMKKGDLADLVPVRHPQLRLVEFDFDVMELRGARTVADFPSVTTRRPSYIVAFKFTKDEQREPLFVDELTARILKLSDGRRSAADIVRQLDRENGKAAKDDILKWIEQLFLRGLLGLQEVPETTEAGI